MASSVFYWLTLAFYLLALLMGIGVKSRKIFYIFLGVFVANIGGCTLFFMQESREVQERRVQQAIEYEIYVKERTPEQHLMDAIRARGREKYIIRREFGDGQKNALKREEAHKAAQLKAQAEIRALVEQGVNLELPGEYGKTPLMFAVRYADSDMIYPGTVKVLVDLGADLDAQDPRGWTPLHFACAYLKIDTIKFLLEKGADPTVVTDEGQSPLAFLQGRNADDAATLEEVRSLLIEAQKKITDSRQSRAL
ncbi:ankyrin repeat domain-containing protein [Kiritimatiellota bacterium B12222]|nr:ankyrin repeat domain-containing protein [Kiritimatiellota bacterium B12222]